MLKFVKILDTLSTNDYVYIKIKTMYNLMSFKEARIEALLNELNKKNKRIQQLETFVFELATDDCPDWYKDVIKKEVFSNTDEV